uniref:Uncharacterized protein n=1 Tax=Arundo donax TaxID=35708 RepID=A0A0A9QI24_ARUDO
MILQPCVIVSKNEEYLLTYRIWCIVKSKFHKLHYDCENCMKTTF